MRKALVPIDTSSISKSLISYAFAYARKEGLDKIDFLHVIPKHEQSWDYRIAELDQKFITSSKEQFLAIINKEIENGANGVDFELHIATGIPYSRIVEKAEEDYAIILIGHRGLSNVERFFIGSVASRVVRHAPCTVLVYHPRED